MLYVQRHFHRRAGVMILLFPCNGRQIRNSGIVRHSIELNPFDSMCSESIRVVGLSLVHTLYSTRSVVPYVVGDKFVDDSREAILTDDIIHILV